MNLMDLMIKIGVNDEASGAISTIATGVRSFAKAGAVAVGAVSTAIGGMAAKAVSAYADYEQLSGGVEKLFGKDTAKTMMRYAQDAYKSAGMSANQFMEQSTSFAASLIQSYQGDTMQAAEQANKAMVAISDNFNTFGGDIQAVQSAYQGFAKQNYTMLDNLKLGYGGTKSEMERLIKDANEYAKANGMAADLSIESFGDIVEAIDLVQQKQGIAGTTAKEAATTISGSIGMMKAAWQNLLVAFADKNANLGQYFSKLTDSAKTAFNNILPVAKQAIKGIGQIIADIVPTIGSMLPELVNDVLPDLIKAGTSLLSSIIAGIAQGLPMLIEAIPDILGAIWDGLVAGWPAMKEAGLKLLEMVGNGIQAAGEFVVDAAHTIWTDILGGSEESWEQISTATSEAWNGIKDGLSNIWGTISENATNIWEGVKGFFSENGGAITESIAGAWDTISEKLGTAWEGLSTLANSIFTGLQNFWDTWGSTITTALGSVWDTITTAFSGALDVLTSAFDTFSALFNGDWEGFWDGVLTTGETLWNSITDTLSSLWDGLQATGAAIWEAIGDDVEAAWESIQSTAESMWEAIKSSISTVWDSIVESVSSAVESVQTTVSDVWESIKSTVSDVVESISSTVSSVFTSISDTASSIWSSIQTTISDAITNAKNTVSDMIDAIVGLFDFSWEFPSLKLPHFSVTGSFSLSPPSVPHLSISWYKKAYENPYLFDTPTVVGAMGFGDGNGAEMVYGHEALLRDISEAVSRVMPQQIRLYLDGDKLVGGTSERMDSTLGNMQQYQLRWEGA